jgi:prepilin-type N-terminal cleavage/methylation domain-containing protein/prepilin-type processing-associated H-X9-DG protein
MHLNADALSQICPKCNRGFTMVELLVVVAVVALLTLRLAAFASDKDQTLRAQCAGHLRQMALTTAILANDNGDNLPVNNISASSWPWDMAWNVGNTFTNYMPVQTLYCPASGFSSTDNSNLWVFGSPSWHVIGYAQTFSGTADLNSTNLNATLTPQRIPMPPPPSGLWMSAPLASRRVLFADSTISLPGQSSPALAFSYQWVDISGGYVGRKHRSCHMDGALPAGGNLAMLDGHVEWRNFSLMVPRSLSGISSPVWWW